MDLETTGMPGLALWGGVECTHSRVGDVFTSQLDRSGHSERPDDLHRFASLGIRTLRYPVLWERTAPRGPEGADWTFADERLESLRALGIEPVVGLLHHGSGPPDRSLLDPRLPEELAAFAGALARRHPWIRDWTPVNEPLTTARFSALYGVWYPHARDDLSFVRALLIQGRATVLAMRAVRTVNPGARLVQTEDLGKTYASEPLQRLADFYNERRWLAWDLLCGRVGPDHALWNWLLGTGIQADELLWFVANPCPPDVLGVNYYVTGERWLDHRPERYPERYHGTCDGVSIVDIETARCLATPTPGLGPLLEEAWQRYGLPIAVTEAHIDGHRVDQLRWLRDIWEAAESARAAGADVRAVTVWALLGSFDWNSLLTDCRGYYEPGPFDVRGPTPRPTALARLMRELGAGLEPSHPVLRDEGWWRRPGRCFGPPVSRRTVAMAPVRQRRRAGARPAAPILLSGATGTLGRAFARMCEDRAIDCVVLDRAALDIADPASVAAAIAAHRPWAVVNASGHVRIDEAEDDPDRCMRDNALGPAVLAARCAAAGIGLLTFSSDHVFDGRGDRPRVESDPTRPLNAYGRSKARAEASVLAAHPGALVVRTSVFFGPWDRHNVLHHALSALEAGGTYAVPADGLVSPTFVPDLVNACLDLLVDGERGIWHLANQGAVTWVEFVRRAAALAGLDASRVVAATPAELGHRAPRPRHAALDSERGRLLPTLGDAVSRFVDARAEAARRAPPPAPTFGHVANDSVRDALCSVGT